MSNFQIGQRVTVNGIFWGVIKDIDNECEEYLDIFTDDPLPGNLRDIRVDPIYVKQSFKNWDRVELIGRANGPHLCKVLGRVDAGTFRVTRLRDGVEYDCTYSELVYLDKWDSGEGLPEKECMDKVIEKVVHGTPLNEDENEALKKINNVLEEVRKTPKYTWSCTFRDSQGTIYIIPGPKHFNSVEVIDVEEVANMPIGSIHIVHEEGRCWMKDLSHKFKRGSDNFFIEIKKYDITPQEDKPKEEYAISYPLLKEYLW